MSDTTTTPSSTTSSANNNNNNSNTNFNNNNFNNNNSNSQSNNPNRRSSNMADSVTTSLKSAIASLDPLAKNVSKEINKGFHQALQYAGEKIGTAEKTALSKEYLELEIKVDRLKAVHENLVKIAALQVSPGTVTDLKFSVYGALNNVADTFGTQDPNYVNEKLSTVSVNNQSPNQIMAEEFVNAGIALGDDTPVGSALIKCSEVQKKIGKSRIQMNGEINEKFVRKLMNQLETSIRYVYTARRHVHNNRLKLDSIKSRARSANPEKVDQLSDELQLAQADFNLSVSTSVELMKNLLNSNELLSALADFMAAMLEYFKQGFDLLSELAPELDSMKVTQDSLSQSTYSPSTDNM